MADHETNGYDRRGKSNLTESHVNIMNESLRYKHPSKILCYKDIYRESFLYLRSRKKFRNLVESLLIKKYSHNTANGSSPSLFEISMKLVEIFAFH